jgi:hypothetical protein
LFVGVLLLKRLLAIILLIVVVIAAVVAATRLLFLDVRTNQNIPSDFHFGVSFCGNTTDQAKTLIDTVKSFTNLLVVQSGPVSVNETSLNEIVSYAINADLDVIVYFGYFNKNYTWQVPWLDYAQQTYGDRLLGIYMHDEPGGVTLDANWTSYFKQLSIRGSAAYYEHQPAIDLATNSTLPLDSYQLNQTAYHFLMELQKDPDLAQLKTRHIQAFTSDYGLYWFDYQGGYDTVFGELGSNESTAQTIALVRGAANMQNKTWGTIITWSYNQPPYLENATQMYSDLMLSYLAGAKYSVIFDYPYVDDNPYGLLTEYQLAAMEQFWRDIHTTTSKDIARAAFVMPHAYGWGLRNENDSIWGLWAPDNSSLKIWNIMQFLIGKYNLNLDIVYDDQAYPVTGKYAEVYWWNQTR